MNERFVPSPDTPTLLPPIWSERFSMALEFRWQTFILLTETSVEQSCCTRSAFSHPPADHQVSAAVCPVRQLRVKQPFGGKKAVNQADSATSESKHRTFGPLPPHRGDLESTSSGWNSWRMDGWKESPLSRLFPGSFRDREMAASRLQDEPPLGKLALCNSSTV